MGFGGGCEEIEGGGVGGAVVGNCGGAADFGHGGVRQKIDLRGGRRMDWKGRGENRGGHGEFSLSMNRQ